MRTRARLSILALILAASTVPCMAQARGGAAAARPAVAYTTDGILYLATETGQVMQKIEAELPIGDFAVSPDLKTVVFAAPHPGEIGGPLFILDVASGSDRAGDAGSVLQRRFDRRTGGVLLRSGVCSRRQAGGVCGPRLRRGQRRAVQRPAGHSGPGHTRGQHREEHGRFEWPAAREHTQSALVARRQADPGKYRRALLRDRCRGAGRWTRYSFRKAN